MLKLFNSLTKKKEVFEPVGNVVGIYTCGPSVYQFAHIGNFRTFIFEDVLVRYLKFKGYKVKRVMNLTDVEDKAIITANKKEKSLKELTEYYSKVFFEDMNTFKLLPADVFPRATEHIPDIVEIIKKIMDNGFAFKGDDGSIYYDISKYDGFGKLSSSKIKLGKKKIKRDDWGEDTLIIGDFALWKSYEKKDGDVFWETELGKGRPGWHIECSAMCSKHLGKHFDIHTGGIDNVFPHHESVIAQNFGAFGVNPSKYWLHCRHLMVNGEKMSKSKGNYYTVEDLVKKGFDPMAIKYLLMSMNYRRKLNFSFERIKEAQEKLFRIKSAILKLETENGDKKLGVSAWKRFEKTMDDNLNTGKALKVIEKLADKVIEKNIDKNSSIKILKIFKDFDTILGLGLFN